MNLPNIIPIPFLIEFVSIPGSNYRKGRTALPTCMVIHVADGSKRATINQFTNPASQVSSHLLICKDGKVVQFVSTSDTAFGNGIVGNPTSEIVLSRPENPNEYTISIENEGYGANDFTALQYEMNAKVISFLSKKWNIPIDSTHVIRHREITDVKDCPGIVNVEKIIRRARSLT